MTSILVDGNVIMLGHVGDSNATVVQFPVADIIASFGDGGSWKLLVLRPNDSEAYEAAAVSVADGVLSWTVSAYDVEQAGNGACQLQYTVDDATKMSQKYRTSTKPSLVDGGGGGSTAKITVRIVSGEDHADYYISIPANYDMWSDFVESAYNPLISPEFERMFFIGPEGVELGEGSSIYLTLNGEYVSGDDTMEDGAVYIADLN